jgi:hypothetical protein
VKRQLCILKKVSRASLYQTIDPSALPCFVVLQLVQPAVATPPCSLRFRCPVKPGACPRAGTVRRYEPECCALGHVAARVRPTLRGSRAGIPSVSSANRSGASGTAGAVTKQHAAQPKNPPPLSEPAASRTSDRALPKSCDDRATDKELSGNAKAAFITDCRNENAQPEKAASSPPLPTRSRVSLKISNSKNRMPLHGGPWARSASMRASGQGRPIPDPSGTSGRPMISSPNSVLVLAIGYNLFRLGQSSAKYRRA